MTNNTNKISAELLSEVNKGNDNTSGKFRFLKIRHRGFIDAGHTEGNPSAFKISIDKLYNRLFEKYGIKKTEGETNHQLNIKKLQQLNKEIDTNNNFIEKIRNERIPELETKIADKKTELKDLKQKPSEDYNIKKDKLNLFVISSVWFLLIPYLFVFYSSAIYSAFFRDFKAYKTTLFNSILYPKTYSEAFYMGETVFMFVVLGPVVFLAISIILHKSISDFHLTKNKVIFFSISAVILFFDFILAYHISEKIYNAESLISFTNQDSYSVSKAIFNSNFWLIMMFGLVAYVIWGILYHYFDSDRAVNNKSKSLKHSIEQEIKDYLNQIDDLKKEIIGYENRNYELQIELSKLSTEKEIISINKYELTKVLSEYTIGWMQYLSKAGLGSLIKDVQDIYDSFVHSKNEELNHINT